MPRPLLALAVGLLAAGLGSAVPTPSAAQPQPHLICVRNDGGFVARVTWSLWSDSAQTGRLGPLTLNIPAGWQNWGSPVTLTTGGDSCSRHADGTRVRIKVEGVGLTGPAANICEREYSPARSVLVILNGTAFSTSCVER